MNREIVLWKSFNKFRGTMALDKLAKIYVSMAGFKFINEEEYLDHVRRRNKLEFAYAMEQYGGKQEIRMFKGISDKLEGIDDGLFNDMLNSINAINYENSIQFVEDAIHILSSISGYYDEVTPPSVFNVPLSLFDIKEGQKVIDYFNGLSSLHIEILKKFPGKDIDYYGQEKDDEIYQIGQFIELLLSGKPSHIIRGDSIDDPKFRDNRGELMTFDYAVSVPPFTMSIDKQIIERDIYNRFKYLRDKGSTVKSDWIIIQHLLSSINDNGKAAVLMPLGVLFRGGRETEIRRGVILDDLLEAVIKLPEALLPYTAVGSCWMIFNNNKPENKKNKIQFIDLSNYLQIIDRRNKSISNEGIEKATADFMNFRESDESIILDLKDLEKKDYNLNAFDFTKTERIYEEIGDEVIPLKEVGMIRRGVQVTKNKLNSLNLAENRNHYMVSLGNIDEDGKIKVDETDLIAAERRWIDLYEAQTGDILITSRGNIVKIAVVEDTDKKYIVSSNLFTIRLNPKLYKPEILKFFLESETGQKLIESLYKGSIVTSISNSDLDNLLIPDVPIEKQEKAQMMIIKSKNEYEEGMKKIRSKFEAEMNDINNLLFK